jgi:hypothetical protein
MTAEAQAWESSALRELKRQSEERGLEFHLQPPRKLVPSFLAGYVPDAIIKRPDGGGIIIELKRQRSAGSDRQLSKISKLVATEKGWEFRVIYENPATEGPTQFAEPTLEQITARLDEVEDLANTGHPVPALILGWAVLEALARLASAHDRPRGPLTPLQAVQTLAEEGYLESEAAHDLRQLANTRNAVAHGDLSAVVSAEQVGNLLWRLRVIAAEATNVGKAQNV